MNSTLQEFIEVSIKIIKSKVQVNSNGQMVSTTLEIGGKVRGMVAGSGPTKMVTATMENGIKEELKVLVSTYHKVISNKYRSRVSR